MASDPSRRSAPQEERGRSDVRLLSRSYDIGGARTVKLSWRQIEILRLLVEGKSNREIAAELVLSEKTVDHHLSQIFAKIDVSNRAGATARELQQQLQSVQEQGLAAIRDLRRMERAHRRRMEEMQRREEAILQALETAYAEPGQAEILVAASRLAFVQMARLIAGALDRRAGESRGHVERVAAASIALGRELRLEGESLELLRSVAVLHDIGMLSVPESILNRPGVLDEHERAIMRMHTVTGSELVGATELLSEIGPAVRAHHERFDGAGYPDGLAGEAIPLAARIVAVVDCFDAMTHDRPYRPAIPQPAALAEIEREAGRQFDPRVAAVFVTLVRRAGAALWIAPVSAPAALTE